MKRFLHVFLPFALITLLAAHSSAVEGSWTGTLGAAPADAKDDVVATLTVKDGDKTTVLNLRAAGEVAKTLKDWASTGVKATVRGNMPDKTSIKVSKAEKAE